MHEAWLEILRQDQTAGAMMSFILAAVFYIIAKTTIWWALFGTGKLLFRKYTFKQWGVFTLMGLACFGLLILFGACLIWLYDAESTTYWIVLCITLFFSLRVWLREVFSIFGLLRGDWNPFEPKLRFFAWDETYILCLLGNGSKTSGGGIFDLSDLFYTKSKEIQKLEDAMWQQKINENKGHQ